MSTVSGIKPTGHMTLGNDPGAVRRCSDTAYDGSAFFVADLYIFTVDHDPSRRKLASSPNCPISGIMPGKMVSVRMRRYTAIDW